MLRGRILAISSSGLNCLGLTIRYRTWKALLNIRIVKVVVHGWGGSQTEVRVASTTISDLYITPKLCYRTTGFSLYKFYLHTHTLPVSNMFRSWETLIRRANIIAKT